MKSFWFIVGGSAVLTLGLVCVVSYRMSKPDSAAQPQNAHQENEWEHSFFLP
jgi:hypothetical protein